MVRGPQLDIRGGIFLSVCSPDQSNQHETDCLFYVAGNISQNYLPCSCLLALSVVGQDFPRIGAATSSNPRPFIPVTQAQERRTQGRCSEMLLWDATLRDAVAYDSRQFEPKTPRTMSSCPSESPLNCPVRTILGDSQPLGNLLTPARPPVGPHDGPPGGSPQAGRLDTKIRRGPALEDLTPVNQRSGV